jgi:hypothetical protein
VTFPSKRILIKPDAPRSQRLPNARERQLLNAQQTSASLEKQEFVEIVSLSGNLTTKALRQDVPKIAQQEHVILESMEKTQNVRIKAARQLTSMFVATAELLSRTRLIMLTVWLIPIV